VEDWLAAVAGSSLLAVVVAGWRPRMPGFKWQSWSDVTHAFAAGHATAILTVAATLLIIALPALILLGASARRFLAGFTIVFALAWLSQWIAGNASVNAWGLEYVIFGLGLGLFLNHAFTLPAWLREGARTEFYIKTGLVIMGSSILFPELMKAGSLGMIQAVLVVLVVWYVAFWLSRKLKVDDELGVMLSSAVAICGVSAAIASCGAIQGDRRKLSYVTSLVLIVAVPMMILMPWAVKIFGIPHAVAGAWLGGTLDTSGSVVAAGELIGKEALDIGVIVKFSQNVLMGVAAFVLSIWWAVRSSNPAETTRPSVRLIWDRFPKFVLGFMVASLVFSFALDPAVAKSADPILRGFRNFWFAMAFVSIGLETHFGDLARMQGGRPAVAFLGAQAINVVWTLLLAWLLFGPAAS
jgi:uncharacterized membrane protein YadS